MVIPCVVADEIQWNRDDGFIDFYQFHFLFPEGTRRDLMEVRGSGEVKQFCKDFVEHATIMFILATISCFIVILSLVHFLMALSGRCPDIKKPTISVEVVVKIRIHQPVGRN